MPRADFCEYPHFTTAQAARYLGCSPAFLEKRRANDQPPVFFKQGCNVYYLRVDLDSYLKSKQDYVQDLPTSDEVITRIVAAAPRFSEEQRLHLVGVLRGGAV